MSGPNRHQFELGLTALSAEAGYKEALRQRFSYMQSRKVPVVFSLMHLAVLSGVSWLRLRSIVRRERLDTDYHVYTKQKASGGQRWICVPAVEVRAVQSWITTHILNSRGALASVNDVSQAYGEGCSILRNAEQHSGAPWIVKVDIHSFFESVSERQVYWVFRRLGYAALLSLEMARICTRVAPPAAANRSRERDVKRRWNERNTGLRTRAPYGAYQSGHLPQGAPSSPMLSNLVAAGIDKRVSEIVTEAGGIYTRYADDLVVSFSSGSRVQCESILRHIRRILGANGFVVNRKKTHVLGPGARKVVTGLLVNDFRPRLKHKTKNHIEVALHYMETKGFLDHARHVRAKQPIAYLNHLSGLIEFARSIEPSFGEKSASRLENICAANAAMLEVLKEFTAGEDFAVSRRRRP